MSDLSIAPVDVVAVARAAQQLARESEFVKLIETLMRIALAHGGAERGLLILPQGEGFRVAAQASAGRGEAVTIAVSAEAPPGGAEPGCDTEPTLPEALLRHVAATRETFVVDDPAAQQPFADDPYLSRHQPHSVLCIPLLRQAALGGVLYLENRQTPHAFTPQAIAVLEVLAAQAVVSLDNANLCAGLLRENSERRRAEAALRAGGARFVAILDSALDAIIAIDSEQRIVYFNAAAEKMFGWSAAEAIGHPIDRLIPERFRAAHREHVRRFAESGFTQRVRGVPFEVHGLRANGEEFPLDAAISRGVCDGQKLLTVMLRDITERQRVDAELRQHRAHLEELVAQRTAELTALQENLATELADLQRLHELSGRLLAENRPVAVLHEVLQAAIELLGASKGKLQLYDEHENVLNIVAQVGFNQDFVDTFRSVPPFFAICGTALGLRQRIIVEDALNDPRFADERELYIANDVVGMQSTPLYGINGQLYGVLTTHFRTAHRPSERELRLLDLYAQQATRVIENSERAAQLALAMRKAEEADRLKSAFLMTMSHELRTPLNAILGYAQILARDTSLDERQADGLNTIRQSGEYLLSLINDILDLSKIEAGRLELGPAPLNLPVFLQGVAGIIAVKAEQKGLAFAFEAPPDLPGALLADEKRLRQVLLNLLGNAVKFAEHGEVSLRVRSLPTVPGQARLRFEVRDTGIGIDAGQIEAIFQPFEQFGAAQQRSGGTGLGLTISRQLVRLMGSDIHVKSQPGKGSLFAFELSVAQSGDTRAAPLAPRVVTGYHGARRKLLIVDDVPSSRRMLADFLAALGFAVCEAGNGREAIAQAEAERPDLIVMDALMPVLDGSQAIEVIHRIRAIPGLGSVPVLAVSARTTGDDADRLLADGASALIDKPIDFERLLDLIGSQLGLAWTEAPPAPDSGPLLPPPPEEMAVLRQLALTGNMRDIKQHSEHLRRLDARYAPFADHLRDLARRYQSQAILALVQQYQQEHQEEHER